MNKNILILLVALVCLAVAGTAFAEATFKGPTQTTAAVTTIIGSASYQPSTNVVVDVFSTVNNYCVTSTHNLSLNATGGRSFGATTSSGLQYMDVNATTTAPVCSSETQLATGFTSL
jgi:hypothetical protein